MMLINKKRMILRKPVFSALMVMAGLMISPCVQANDNQTPSLNKKVLEYVETVIGEQVDRGECWDLAFQALNRIDAKWDGNYIFGIELNPDNMDIYPGDIIQFKDVEVKYQEGNTFYTETMAHHTAIVYRVLDKGVFELAHQNTGFSGRTVGVSKLDLDTVVSGRMWFYRPAAE